MDDNDKEEILKKALKGFLEFQRDVKPIANEILDIFEKRDIDPQTAYLIMRKMVNSFEKCDPVLKLSREMAAKLVGKGKGINDIFDFFEEPTFDITDVQPSEQSKSYTKALKKKSKKK